MRRRRKTATSKVRIAIDFDVSLFYLGKEETKIEQKVDNASLSQGWNIFEHSNF